MNSHRKLCLFSEHPNGNKSQADGALAVSNQRSLSLADEDAAGIRNSHRVIGFFFAWILASLILCSAVRSTSLVIDEAFSAWLASHRTFWSLWQSLVTGDSSDLQMSGYYVYLWGWVQTFGRSEYALRAANMPFAFLFCLAFGGVCWRVWNIRYAWLIVVLEPYLRHQMNGARPYLCVISLGCTAAAGLLVALTTSDHRESRGAISISLVALALGVWFHLMTLVIIPALITITLFSLWPTRVITKNLWQCWRRPFALALPFFILQVSYIAWTFTHTTVYSYGSPSLFRVVGVFYDFIGLEGFGPSRDLGAVSQFPSSNLEQMLPLMFPILILSVALVFFALQARQISAYLIPISFCVSYCAVVALSLATAHRVPVRHFAALFPLLLFIPFGMLQSLARPKRKIAGMILWICFFGVWIGSDLLVRFSRRHDPVDSRGIANLVVEEHKRSELPVLWVGDLLVPAYYGVRPNELCGGEIYHFNFNRAVELVNWPIRLRAWGARGCTSTQIAGLLADLDDKRENTLVVQSLTDPNTTSELVASGKLRIIRKVTGFLLTSTSPAPSTPLSLLR